MKAKLEQNDDGTLLVVEAESEAEIKAIRALQHPLIVPKNPSTLTGAKEAKLYVLLKTEPRDE